MANFLNQIKNSLSRSLPKRIENGEFFVFLHHYNLRLDYQLKVSAKRKSLSLELSRGNVIVRAPYWLSMQDIEGFVLSKQDWLMDKLQQQAELPPEFSYQEGEKLLYKGRWLQLKINTSSQFRWYLDEPQSQLVFYIPRKVKDHKAYVKRKLKAWYIEQAEAVVADRVKYFEQVTGLSSSGLELKMFKSKWGCCYRSGLIKINPMLIGAPAWVLDCVIVHELCHLKHMNHSAAFWQLNKDHCTHCDDTKSWLKQHGLSLYLN